MIASDGVKAGFDFLGHIVRQYPVGKYQTGCNTYGEPLGFKTRITPSKNAQTRHHDELTRIIRQKRGAPQEALINELNPVIKGWANFYSRAVSSQVFSKMDWLLFRPLWRWASRRHPTKSSGWIKRRYWLDQDRRHWIFKDRKTRAQLALHASTPIKRHTKVRGSASPYDGNLLYWAWRLQEHPEVPRRTSFLMRRQKGQCAWCGLFFTSMDEVTEVDHVQPRSNGGTSMSRNLQLLHGHCHDAKTAQDGSTGLRPKERKVSMTMTIHRGAVCQETGKHGSEGERDAARHIA